MINISYAVQPVLESVPLKATDDSATTSREPAFLLKLTGCLLLILLVTALSVALVIWLSEVIPPIVKAYSILSERRPF